MLLFRSGLGKAQVHSISCISRRTGLSAPLAQSGGRRVQARALRRGRRDRLEGLRVLSECAYTILQRAIRRGIRFPHALSCDTSSTRLTSARGPAIRSPVSNPRLIEGESGVLSPNAGRQRRILIVDDHPVVRSGLELLISGEPDLQVCGECDTAGDAIRLVRQHGPDLVLIDLSLKGGSGLDLCKHLAAIDPAIRLLVISVHDEALYADRALRAGARGYVNKAAPAETLLQAIRAVLGDRVWLSEAMQDRLLASFSHGASPAQSPLETLSDRELAVFELIGCGLTTREVAARLHLSPKSAECYRENLKRKLRLQNSVELIQHAVQWVLENRAS